MLPPIASASSDFNLPRGTERAVWEFFSEYPIHATFRESIPAISALIAVYAGPAPPLEVLAPADAKPPLSKRMRSLSQLPKAEAIISEFFPALPNIVQHIAEYWIAKEKFWQRVIIGNVCNLVISMMKCEQRVVGRRVIDLSPKLLDFSRDIHKGVTLFEASRLANLEAEQTEAIKKKGSVQYSTEKIPTPLENMLLPFLIHLYNFGHADTIEKWSQFIEKQKKKQESRQDEKQDKKRPENARNTICPTWEEIITHVEMVYGIELEKIIDLCSQEIKNLLFFINSPDELICKISYLLLRFHLFIYGRGKSQDDPEKILLLQALVAKEIEVTEQHNPGEENISFFPILFLLPSDYVRPPDFSLQEYMGYVEKNPAARMAYELINDPGSADMKRIFLDSYGSRLFDINTDSGHRYAIAVPALNPSLHIRLFRKMKKDFPDHEWFPIFVGFIKSIVLGKAQIGNPMAKTGMVLVNLAHTFSFEEVLTIINSLINKKKRQCVKDAKLWMELVPIFQRTLLPVLVAGIKKYNGSFHGVTIPNNFHKTFIEIFGGGIVEAGALIAKEFINQIRSDKNQSYLEYYEEILAILFGQMKMMSQRFDSSYEVKK